VTPTRPPRYRVTIYELRDGKTTQVIDAYGSGFITAVATHFDGDNLDIHFRRRRPPPTPTTHRRRNRRRALTPPTALTH